MQIVRIYRKSGGRVQAFRPFHMTAQQIADMRDKYPEGYFNWLH